MIVHSKFEGKKHSSLLRFEKINTIPSSIYISNKIFKFLSKYLYKILAMVSKNIIDKFRIKMHNLSSSKTLVMENLTILP